MYVSGWEVSRGLSATLSTALTLYEANREVGQANMTMYMTRIQEAADKASEITRAMAAEPSITKKAGQAILARIDAFNAFRHGNVVQRGSIVRDILEGNGITRENLDKIRALLPTLNNPEVLEKHALTLLPGEAGYDYKFARLVDPGFFKTIEKICRMRLNYASAGRSAYESAFSSYASDQSALESALAQLEKKLASVAPAMLGFVSAENVTRDWIRKNKPSFPPGLSSNWVPPDPAYFYDPIPSDTAYLKKVERLLAKYQKIVLPVFERMKKGGYKEVRLLDEMAAELKKITPGWINLEPGDFSTRYNKYSSTAYNLYRTVQGKGWGGPGTPVTKAYLKVMRILNSISTRHADKQNRTRIIKGLELTVRSITGFLKEPDRMGGPASAKSWQDEILRKAGPESEARGFKTDPRIAGLINSLLGLEKKLGNYIESAEKQKVAQAMALIHELYKKFASFYSNKDINSLLSLISPGWSASDGSGIDDIEELLDNSFSVFDNIKYELKDLKIKPAGNGDFQVTYTSRITGQILDQDLEHNETSQVSDIVRIKDGRAIIMKTMGGCFWQ
ncbi:MAG: hypothetical protein L3J03_05520 [Desulfobacterales bacterium]|nr:hypothetical protein [Desulfobacterales bacterium]